MAALVPPTGIFTEVRTGRIDVFFTSVSGTDVAGYNLYRATESGGPYTLVNTDSVFNDPIRVEEEIIRSTDVVDEIGNVGGDPSTQDFLFRTTTTEDVVKFVEIQRYIDANLDSETTYYYRLTTVTLDGDESHYSEEFSDTPIAIPTTTPIPFPPKTC